MISSFETFSLKVLKCQLLPPSDNWIFVHVIFCAEPTMLCITWGVLHTTKVKIWKFLNWMFQSYQSVETFHLCKFFVKKKWNLLKLYIYQAWLPNFLSVFSLFSCFSFKKNIRISPLYINGKKNRSAFLWV